MTTCYFLWLTIFFPVWHDDKCMRSNLWTPPVHPCPAETSRSSVAARLCTPPVAVVLLPPALGLSTSSHSVLQRRWTGQRLRPRNCPWFGLWNCLTRKYVVSEDTHITSYYEIVPHDSVLNTYNLKCIYFLPSKGHWERQPLCSPAAAPDQTSAAYVWAAAPGTPMPKVRGQI